MEGALMGLKGSQVPGVRLDKETVKGTDDVNLGESSGLTSIGKGTLDVWGKELSTLEELVDPSIVHTEAMISDPFLGCKEY